MSGRLDAERQLLCVEMMPRRRRQTAWKDLGAALAIE